ncbi:MAG TPA: T9SS type A sorting domain-containing protein, partial [Saprospiraceae bacterium]|nr:T9SS type A sorting domain-containing protein [Saprospiraceae bacterium]
ELRPLIIYFHSGNFIPYPDNGGVVGTHRDSSVVAFCMKLARCGYVVASADYRLGWNPKATTDEVRRWGIINAAYRGMQDARTCIRFFRESAQMGGNPYRICENRIGLFGDDTGGYIAAHAAVLDNYEKILEDEELWIYVDSMTGFIPMIIPEVNGDVTGKTIGINPPNFPPFPAGDTLCYPNHVRDNSSFQVAVNLAGAVAYKPWIMPGQPPIISVQTPYDDTTPFYCGDVFVKPDLYVINVCGAHAIAEAEELVGNTTIFDNIEDYLVNDFQRSVEAVALSRNDGYNCLFPVLGDTITDINPWDFWSPEDNVNHVNGILYNPHMSKAKAELYMDSILAYVLPRIYVAMDIDVPGASCITSTDYIPAEDTDFSLKPNPTVDEIEISSTSGEEINEARLYDVKGTLVKQDKVIGQSIHKMNIRGMSPGIYILHIQFDRGITARKVIIQ